jgi:hypothetical protein
MAASAYPNLKQDLIASVVQRELEFQAKLLPTVTNVSQFAVPGAKSISFPKLSSFTVNSRAFGAADTEQVLTDTFDQLLLDQNKIVSWIVDAKDDVQTTIGAQAENAKRAAAAHARDIDTNIVSVIEAAGRTDWGVATGDITRDIILDMMEGYLDAEGVESDAVLVVGNDQHKALLKISEFTEHQIYGPNDAIRGGQIGTVYGMPVIRRSGLAASTYYIYGKEAVAAGFQAGPQMDSEKDIQYGTGAMRFAMDVLYGLKALRLNEKGAGASESALIFKDNN